MNKIASLLLRERKPISLYFSNVTHKMNLHFQSPSAASFILHIKKNQREEVLLSFERKMSFVNRIKTKVRSMISDNTKAKIGGCLTFEKIADDIDYTAFLQRFEMPDTFYSWFLALQLHVWMTMSATVTDANGKVFKISLVDSMWNDVEHRMEQLVTMKSSQRKEYLKELVMEFHACLVAYDEGILSDDTVLAAAAWRMLFTNKPVHPQLLENAVLYIRKQLAYLESQNLQNIVYKGSILFLPLDTALTDDEM